MDNLISKSERHHENYHRSNGNRDEAVSGCLLNLIIVLGSVIVADDWSGRNGNSHIKRDKEIVDVHDDGDSRYPILSKISHDNQIK